MSETNLKLPLQASLNTFADNKISSGYQLQGKQLPCKVTEIDNGFVTVSFQISDPIFDTLPQVKVPIAMSEYVRLPIQVGDSGFCIAADARLGAITGQGNYGLGNVNLDTPGNLSALVFVPLSNVLWQSVNENLLVLYGPEGVYIQDVANQVNILLNDAGITINGNITLQGNIQMLGNLAVNGKITATQDVVAGNGTLGSTSLLNHVHGGVQNGTGNTTPPVH